MSWFAAATKENCILSLYEIKHTFFAFSESLFAKNHSFTSFSSLLTIWKKCFYTFMKIKKVCIVGEHYWVKYVTL